VTSTSCSSTARGKDEGLSIATRGLSFCSVALQRGSSCRFMLIQDHRQVMILGLESLGSSTAVVVPGLLDLHRRQDLDDRGHRGTHGLHNDGLDRSGDLDHRHDRKIDKLASAIAAMNTAMGPTCSVSVWWKPIRGRSARRGLTQHCLRIGTMPLCTPTPTMPAGSTLCSSTTTPCSRSRCLSAPATSSDTFVSRFSRAPFGAAHWAVAGAGGQRRPSSVGPAGTCSCQGATGCSPDLAAELINHAFAFEAGEAKVPHDSG
jgi:hypothetical protein